MCDVISAGAAGLTSQVEILKISTVQVELYLKNSSLKFKDYYGLKKRKKEAVSGVGSQQLEGIEWHEE